MPKLENSKFCCDPLKKHMKRIFKHLRPIVNEDMIRRSYGLLKVDSLLCVNCIKLITKEPEILKQMSTMETVEGSTSDSTNSSISNPEPMCMTPSKNQESTHVFNKDILHSAILPYLDESPIKTSKYTGSRYDYFHTNKILYIYIIYTYIIKLKNL